MDTNKVKDGQQVYYHLNGMKGIACLLIFIGHYIGIYKYAESFYPSIHCIDLIRNSPLSFLIDESYWLYLFFVVSGYLISKSRIGDIRTLFAKIVNRFFRFGLPVLFCYILIFTLYKCIGFHNNETYKVFECIWYQQSFYNTDFTVKDVLLSPIYVVLFGRCTMNGPYWVLQMMFFSSVLIYLINYVVSKLCFTQKYVLEYFFLVIAILLLGFVFPVVSAHLIGMLGRLYEERVDHSNSWYAVGMIIIAIAIIALPKSIIASFSFVVLILLVPKVKILNRVFCGKPCQFLGNISWGIYSFHWPLICSIGALLVMGELFQMGLREAYIIGFFAMISLTIIVAWCFHQTFERMASIINRKLYLFLAGDSVKQKQ